MKHKRMIFIFSGICLVVALTLNIYVYLNRYKRCKEFNSSLFKEQTQCTNDQLSLFCDIAFREGHRIRKWETNINVEIMDIGKLDSISIVEVDSIIDFFSPLIHPLKIQRVSKDGNFRIHRKVEEMPPPVYRTMTIGYNVISDASKSWSILDVDIYESKTQRGAEILLHECLHALGLAHPPHS